MQLTWQAMQELPEEHHGYHFDMLYAVPGFTEADTDLQSTRVVVARRASVAKAGGWIQGVALTGALCFWMSRTECGDDSTT